MANRNDFNEAIASCTSCNTEKNGYNVTVHQMNLYVKVLSSTSINLSFIQRIIYLCDWRTESLESASIPTLPPSLLCFNPKYKFELENIGRIRKAKED